MYYPDTWMKHATKINTAFFIMGFVIEKVITGG